MESIRGYLPGWPKIRLPTYSQLKDGSYFHPPAPPNQLQHQNWVLKEFESKFIAAQEIAVWSNPFKSVVWLLLTQFLLYYFLNSSTPLLSTLAYVCLSVYAYITWVYTIWPIIRVPPENPEDDESWTPVHPDVLSAPELSTFLSDLHTKVKEVIVGLYLLRTEQPVKFCVIMSTLCTLLAVLSMQCPTTALFHGLAFLVLVLPAIILQLSKQPRISPVISFIRDFLSGLVDLAIYRGINAPPRENKDLDEFVPEVTQENVSLLDKALSYVSVKQEPDDQDANLSSGLDNIPSHEEVVGESLASQDLEADLLPSPDMAIRHGPGDDSSDSEVEKPLEMKDYNDSDEEDTFGLELETTKPRGRTPVGDVLGLMAETVTSSVTGSGLLSSASNLVGNLLAQQKPQADPELDEFEFISDDEFLPEQHE